MTWTSKATDVVIECFTQVSEKNLHYQGTGQRVILSFNGQIKCLPFFNIGNPGRTALSHIKGSSILEFSVSFCQIGTLVWRVGTRGSAVDICSPRLQK